jgi:SNF2 family DNA or RNA helicase
MLAPMKFSSAEAFKRQWVSYYYQGAFIKEGGIKRIPEFKEYTKDIVIRRERTEVMPELPLVNRTKLNVIMDDGQEAIYDAEVEKFVEWYEEQVGEITGMAIIAMMAKMRHLVALAKVPATLEHVAEFVENTDRKLAVFAHHVDVQQILYDELKTAHGADIPVLKFTAEMNPDQRNNAVIEFNKSPRAIFVMSQGAGGEGLNLQTCSDCIMHERQWNPGREEQCEGRFIRIGSAATSVSAIYAHLEGITAIDSQLDAIVERKRIQYHEAMSKGETPKWNEDALMRDLASSIVNAHNAKKNRKVLASK